MKCANPELNFPICRECERSKKSKTNEYESFMLVKTLKGRWKCNGYKNSKTDDMFK